MTGPNAHRGGWFESNALWGLEPLGAHAQILSRAARANYEGNPMKPDVISKLIRSLRKKMRSDSIATASDAARHP